MEYKFKVGDKVVGKPEADKHYGITRAGWIGYVIAVHPDSIEVCNRKKREKDSDVYTVEPQYFDLVEEKPVSSQYKTERRKAKEGEKILITSNEGSCHCFKIGEICTVASIYKFNPNFVSARNDAEEYQFLKEEDYEVIVEKEEEEPKQPKQKPKRVRISKAKLLKKNGKEWCEDHEQKVSHAEKLAIVVIGDSAFVFDLDCGVLKVDLDCCEFF